MNRQRYERLTGIVSELSTAADRQDFLFRQGEQAAGAAAAAGLALEGLAGAAASASASSGDATDAVATFQCRVGPHRVTGCLGSIGFADGDEVIVLGQRHGDAWVAQAVARPADRTIWMPPHSGRGHRAFLRSLLTWWGSACLLVPQCMALLMILTSDYPFTWHWMLTSGLSGTAPLLLVVLWTAWRVYPYATLSTALFQALGLPDAASVNLPRITRRHLRSAPDAIQQFHPYTPWVFRY